MVVQFGLRAGPVKREIPSTSLRAGSSLRLKSGCAQDDAVGRSARCFSNWSTTIFSFWFLLYASRSDVFV
jgi:hypothetical protein